MSAGLTEADVERIAIDLFRELGYTHLFGGDIAPEAPASERDSYGEVHLPRRLADSLIALNPSIPRDALEDAARKVTRASASALLAQNHEIHKMLVNGVDVAYRRGDRVVDYKAVLVDYEHPERNDWLIVNQFTIVENGNNRRPDLLVFLNGLPVAVFELKTPAEEKADIWKAFNQIQTYKDQIPVLFTFNCAAVISDGLEARIGSLTADKERFSVWKTIDGERLAPSTLTRMEVLIRGVFDQRRFLSLVRFHTVFEADGKGSWLKKLAAYHQFHAVESAVKETIKASRPSGDKRIGVVWHTTGSGKSLSMVMYAGRIILEPAMENPTIVVITDRNDLDNQLFDTFCACSELLRQTPVQARDRDNLRELLKVASGGVVFTTVQKFMPDERLGQYPKLSDRRNIVVIADEAHRSQYDFVDGYARHMHDALPNASFSGFTGTPIELDDRNTRAVFGEYISVYDIQRAVEDGATVPIYYESRLARLALKEEEKPRIDADFDEITEAEEEDSRKRLMSKWAALESLVGAERRLKLIARDLVDHWEKRHEILDGKAMVVCMSRRVCVDLYDEIIALRPEWHSDDDKSGTLKVIMTGSAADPVEWQRHIRNGRRRKELAEVFKDNSASFRIVIVRDMWLTGFDVPSLTTMYVDKPMEGHGLMQAIARVNRVFKDKPGGLIVDYLGIADSLKRALATYADSGGRGKTALDQNEAVAVMMEKYEIVRDLFHGFDWSVWKTGTAKDRLDLLPSAQEHILAQPDGKPRLYRTVTELSQAFALSVPHEKTAEIRDDLSFFQNVRSALAKAANGDDRKKSPEELDLAIRQLVSGAVDSDQVVDIFSAAGLKKPDISILTDEFLAEVKGMPQRNLAVELLAKLLKGEIKNPKTRRNIIQSRSFMEMLEEALKKYESRAVQTAQIIEELIELARKMREGRRRGEDLGLNDDEIAFYDSLGVNESAVRELGDETLKAIARELVKSLKANLKIDWARRESVRAQIRLAIKRILRRYKYPPDRQEAAIKTVIEQAEELYGEWVA